MHDATEDSDLKPRFGARPWEHLETPYDVELWIEEHNRSMQEHIRASESGHGICFHLREGGAIYLHTGVDAVILDLDGEAGWIAPLICAAAQISASATSIWVLPDDKLIQLVLGLSSLIATSTLVVGHHFGSRARHGGVKQRG